MIVGWGESKVGGGGRGGGGLLSEWVAERMCGGRERVCGRTWVRSMGDTELGDEYAII